MSLFVIVKNAHALDLTLEDVWKKTNSFQGA
jgi:hypothetical protein